LICGKWKGSKNGLLVCSTQSVLKPMAFYEKTTDVTKLSITLSSKWNKQKMGWYVSARLKKTTAVVNYSTCK
jgi:hypothetical protein